MFIIELNIKCFLSRWKRTLVFVCLVALLCAAAGLLGNHFLYGEKSVDPITVMLADEDDTLESRAFYAILTGVEAYQGFLSFEKAGRADALADMGENGAAAVFVIPEGFTESVKNGLNMPYEVIYNANTPLKAGLIRYFSDAFTAMLAASQAGVYAGLDYARQHGTAEDYNNIFRTVNMAYLSLVGSRQNMTAERELGALGGVNIVTYYALCAYVFIMTAGVLLYADIFQANFSKASALRLARAGTGAARLAAANALSFSAMLAGVNAALGVLVLACAKVMGFEPSIPPALIPALLLFLLCAGCFGALVSAMFDSAFPAGVFVTVFSLASLAVSGGVVPAVFLPETLALAGHWTLNHWAVGLLTGCLSGGPWADSVPPMLAWLAVCAAALLWLTARRQKAGGAL